MQPIAIPQDAVRTPLNEVFGTKANVRLLRLLAHEVAGPIGAPDAAEQVGLTEAGARRALRRLARTGFVEVVGGGRTQLFRLRESDALARQIRELFQAEEARHQAFIHDLREALAPLSEIDLAWIEASSTAVGEPVYVGIMAGAQALTHLEGVVRERIAPVEGRYDVTIEIQLRTHAEVDHPSLRSKTVLVGHPRAEGARRSPSGSESHGARVERSRRISEAIARMLRQDSSLRQRAERHVERLLSADQGAAVHDLKEWREILTHYSMQRLLDFIVADTPRAARLRQSSPFFAVLTHDERDEVLASMESGT